MTSLAKWLVAGIGIISSLLIVFLGPMSPRTLAESANVSIGVGDTSFTVQGYTSPGAQVTVIDGGSTIGSMIADSSGAFSQQFTAQSPGFHDLQVYAQDRASRTTNTVSIQVNVAANAETVVNIFLPPTIQLSNNTVHQGEVVTLKGEGAPNTAIIIYIDNTYVTTSIDSSGYWQYSLSTNTLSPGQHHLFAVAQQTNGSQSYPTGNQLFTILSVVIPKPQPPAGQPSTGPQVPKVPIILLPIPGAVVSDQSISVSGIAEPGARIEVWNNGKLVGAVFANGSGKWQLFIQLFDSVNNIKARACIDSTCSDFTKVITVLFQPQVKDLLRFLLMEYVYHVGVSEQITLRAVLSNGQGPYTFVIKWGDGKNDTIKTSLKKLNFSHRFDMSGNYDGTVTVIDSKGQSAQLSFVTTVEHEGVFMWYLLFLLLLLLLSLFIMIVRRRKKEQKIHERKIHEH